MGTLLGWWKGGAMLHYDSDVDVHIVCNEPGRWWDDCFPVFSSMMGTKGWRVVRRYADLLAVVPVSCPPPMRKSEIWLDCYNQVASCCVGRPRKCIVGKAVSLQADPANVRPTGVCRMDVHVTGPSSTGKVGSQNDQRLSRVPWGSLFPIALADFGGVPVRVPCDPELAFQTLYGNFARRVFKHPVTKRVSAIPSNISELISAPLGLRKEP